MRTAQEFWDSTCPEPNTGCLLWTRPAARKGYGQLNWRGRICKAHRLAYELANGSIPSGMCVLHACDTPACVNPEHLFLGTVADNNADMFAKGRHARGERHGARIKPQSVPRGEHRSNAKLTAEKVREVREMHSRGSRPSAIARAFGVSPSIISEVLSGKRWVHASEGGAQ